MGSVGSLPQVSKRKKVLTIKDFLVFSYLQRLVAYNVEVKHRHV